MKIKELKLITLSTILLLPFLCLKDAKAVSAMVDPTPHASKYNDFEITLVEKTRTEQDNLYAFNYKYKIKNIGNELIDLNNIMFELDSGDENIHNEVKFYNEKESYLFPNEESYISSLFYDNDLAYKDLQIKDVFAFKGNIYTDLIFENVAEKKTNNTYEYDIYLNKSCEISKFNGYGLLYIDCDYKENKLFIDVMKNSNSYINFSSYTNIDFESIRVNKAFFSKGLDFDDPESDKYKSNMPGYILLGILLALILAGVCIYIPYKVHKIKKHKGGTNNEE